MPLVLKDVHPRTVIDVGCGDGAWMRVLQEQGIETTGVDGSWVPDGNRPPGFVEHDLEQPLQLEGSFDLAICLEVAQNLSPSSAERLVGDLVNLAPVVLFSAAIPLQGGINHRNEQWPSYWARLFAARDYYPQDLVRPAVWSNALVEPWYAQNTLLYSSASSSAPPVFLDVVHPRHYLAARRADRVGRRLARQLRASRRRLAKLRVG